MSRSNRDARRAWSMLPARSPKCGPSALLGSLMALLVALDGCQGELADGPARPKATASENQPSSEVTDGTVGTAHERDAAMRADDPALFDLALRYFPGTTPAPLPARLARLTRVQLDQTVKTLLPDYVEDAALSAWPRDPLQTNYEYAENLSFNAANFTPFTAWVRAISERVKANPGDVIGCASEGANAACLEREVHAFAQAELNALASTPSAAARACPAGQRPTGNGTHQLNCDVLSPIHDQMIGLFKLAFEWDLTRVVAFTLSGASSGQRWPSQGIHQAHHALEHGNHVAGLNVMGRYYAEKFAKLLSALKSIDDGNGQTALYNSPVLLGMECWSDSANGHYLRDIPFILAGQGGGAFKTGRIVDAQGRSNNDLLISIQNASGIESNVFGLKSLCRGPIV